MNEYVADSMSLIFRLENRKMPEKVKKIFQQAEKGKAKINIPSMVLQKSAIYRKREKLMLRWKKPKNTFKNTQTSERSQ